MKSNGVELESAGWIICAFAVIAVVMSGDHEKCVKIGDSISEGHMSSNLSDSPNRLPC